MSLSYKTTGWSLLTKPDKIPAQSQIKIADLYSVLKCVSTFLNIYEEEVFLSYTVYVLCPDRAMLWTYFLALHAGKKSFLDW